MKKPKVPPLTGLVTAPKPHNSAATQSHSDAVVQLRDEDVPDVDLEPLAAPPDPEPSPEAAPTKPRGRGNVKAKADAAENADMTHRSLYAKPQTLELIRQIAFKERVSAQSLYREGLLLMLREHGYYKDKSIEDV